MQIRTWIYWYGWWLQKSLSKVERKRIVRKGQSLIEQEPGEIMRRICWQFSGENADKPGGDGTTFLYSVKWCVRIHTSGIDTELTRTVKEVPP